MKIFTGPSATETTTLPNMEWMHALSNAHAYRSNRNHNVPQHESIRSASEGNINHAAFTSTSAPSISMLRDNPAERANCLA